MGPGAGLGERLTPDVGRARAAVAGMPSVVLHRSSELAVEYARPVAPSEEPAAAHDVVYVVIAGSGVVRVAGRSQPFGPGEVIVVPAGASHGFERVTADLATWRMTVEPGAAPPP